MLGLSIIRQGRPGLDATRKILAELDPLFPGPSEKLNHELALVLISLQAPNIAAKCLKQMEQAKTQEDMLHYLFHLRTLPIGHWTLNQRKEYFSYWTRDRKKFARPPEVVKWFAEAGRPYSDGASFQNFLKKFLKEAVQNLSDAERKELAGQLQAIDKASVVTYDIKPRPVVKPWTMAELMPRIDRADKGRNFGRGREAYFAAQCIKCHRFGEEGGAVGPDLTAVASRFDRRAILESIVEPSKVISDQYQNERIVTMSGKTIIGRVVDETPLRLVVQPDQLSPERVEVKKTDVETREPSRVSPMPDHLVDVLSEEEIYDLLAFLESAGNKGYRSFR